MAALFGGALESAHETAYLWPCNVGTWRHWNEVQTEWRSNGTGQTWLDYSGVRAYLDESGLCGDERKDTFNGIRAADMATRAVWAQQAKERAAANP